MAYPRPLEELVLSLAKLPGVGRRTAERLAFHLLREPLGRELPPTIVRALEGTRFCGQCGNVTESDPCTICSNPERDRGTVCVLEGPRDVETMERSGAFGGLYHVLMGAWNPGEGVEGRHLDIDRLVRRVQQGEIEEVILATDPDAEGEATALMVLEALEGLEGMPVRVTRLARGLPAGSAIEYLHRGVLEDALEGRRRLSLRNGPGDPPRP